MRKNKNNTEKLHVIIIYYDTRGLVNLKHINIFKNYYRHMEQHESIKRSFKLFSLGSQDRLFPFLFMNYGQSKFLSNDFEQFTILLGSRMVCILFKRKEECGSKKKKQKS